MNSRPTNQSSEFRVEDFPHLRELLRGYFHEDWNLEYGSPREAVEQFCRDSGSDAAAKLAEEWRHFLGVSGGNLDKALERLGQLGGAWNPQSRDEFAEVGKVLARYRGRSGRK
jgi:hypothetical protein